MSDQNQTEELHEDNQLITPEAPDTSTETPPAEPAAPEPSADTSPKREAWYMKEIGTLRATVQEKERVLRELQAKVQAAPVKEDGTPEITPELIEQLALAKAAEITVVQSFNKTCNDIFDKGASEITNFKEGIESLGAMGVLSNNNQPTPLLQAVVEVPNAHKVLHHLAQNPEEVQRIRALPALKQALEVANISHRLSAPAAPQPVSKAGAPIKPIMGNGKAPASIEDTSIPIEEWMKLNDKHEQELRSRRFGGA